MNNEAQKLAPILRDMIEGCEDTEGVDIYAEDYSTSDGDVYVNRAAELLLEQAQRIAELEQYAQNVMAELDAMNANFQAMLKDRNVWRDQARALEKDAARYQWWRDIYLNNGRTYPEAMRDAASPEAVDAAIDAAMNDR